MTVKAAVRQDTLRRSAKDVKASLHLMNETLHTKSQDSISLINRDATYKSHFGEIADNCKAELTKLGVIVVKHSSLRTTNIEVRDRFLLLEKEILNVRGKIQYQHDDLQMIEVSPWAGWIKTLTFPGTTQGDHGGPGENIWDHQWTGWVRMSEWASLF